MSKISTYPSADVPLQLSDRLIGTEAIRPVPSPTPLATKNFSLGELLQLFSSNFPAATLQAVLNAGNIATQNITLTGTISATLIKPINIEDTSGSQGLPFQVLSKGAVSITWVDIPNISGYVPISRELTINGITYDLSADRSWTVSATTPTLQEVTTVGNETTDNIIKRIGDWTIQITDDGGGIPMILMNHDVYGPKGIYVPQGLQINSVDELAVNCQMEILAERNQYIGFRVQNEDIVNVGNNLFTTLTFPTTSTINQLLVQRDFTFPDKPDGTYILATTDDIGTTPTLQQVTDEGNTTNQDIISYSLIGAIDEINNSIGAILDSDGSLALSSNGQTGTLRSSNISGAVDLEFPNAAGTNTIPVSVNGNFADITGNITISAGGGFVPYTGAIANVDLGEFELKAGQISLDTTPTGTASVGTTRWNDTIGVTETTLKGGTVILKNGIDLVARVVNKVTPNATLLRANYTAVRISGAQGQRLAVAYAQANNDNNSADTLGLVYENIATNQEGFIITVGQFEGINTTGSLQGETWIDGDVLYLSPTIPGGITNIKPTGATGHIVVIGYVEYSHAINGKIYVKIMNGWELDELHNVYINTPTNNQLLSYDSVTQLWKNKSVTTVDIADSTNKRYQTDAQQTNNDATSSIQTQLDSRTREILQNFTDYTTTGVLTEQIISNQAITANDMKINSWLNFISTFSRTGTTNATVAIYLNTTSNSLVGAVKIATATMSSSGSLPCFKRDFSINASSVLRGYNFTLNAPTDEIATGAQSTTTLTLGSAYYLISTAALNNVADTVTQRAINLKSSR